MDGSIACNEKGLAFRGGIWKTTDDKPKRLNDAQC
jgi:hypothetical protein